MEYGPLLYAAMGAPNPLTVHFDPEKPEEWFEPAQRKGRRILKLKDDNCHEYWPYMDIHDEPFDVYPIVE